MPGSGVRWVLWDVAGGSDVPLSLTPEGRAETVALLRLA